MTATFNKGWDYSRVRCSTTGRLCQVDNGRDSCCCNVKTLTLLFFPSLDAVGLVYGLIIRKKKSLPENHCETRWTHAATLYPHVSSQNQLSCHPERRFSVLVRKDPMRTFVLHNAWTYTFACKRFVPNASWVTE